MLEICKVLICNLGTWIILIFFLLSLVLIISEIHYKYSELKRYKKIQKEYQSNKKLEYELKDITKKQKQCKINIVILCILICFISLTYILALCNIYTQTISNKEEIININEKIKSGYEVYLNYNDGRKPTKLENYEYMLNDTSIFNININDEKEEIWLTFK